MYMMLFKYFSKVIFTMSVFLIACSSPGDYEVYSQINEEVLRTNPSLVSLKWPSDQQISDLEVGAVKNSVVSLIAREKMDRIIKPECIPADILQRFIPLRNYPKGCDSLFVRYEFGNFFVQLIITSANVRVVIQEKGSLVRKTDEEKLEFIEEIMKQFFKKTDILLSANYNPVVRNGGLGGKMPKQMPTVYWYETLRWWTDGQTACFWLCSSPGTSSGCVDQKDWFAMELSVEKGLRSKRGKLTKEMIDKVLGVQSTE